MSIFKPRVRQGNFLFSVVLTTAKMLFVVILLIAVCGTGILMGVAKAWVETAPELDTSAFDSQARTSFIYDANGLLITDFKGVENRIDAEWNEIPDNLKNAVIAVEDKRFLSHNGVDIKRILGALVTNLLNNNQQGGSTLTQQLIKLTMLSSEQTYKRKLQEAYLALQLERQLSKDEIMLEYLNVIYLGGTNYGVKVAAQDYFGKELRDLSLRECAALARCIRNPYRYNPRLNYYSRKTPEVIEENTDYVLQLMYEQGMITEDEYRQALSETLNVVETSRFTDKLYDNAYYVEYAIYDVVTKMLRKEKLEDNSANRSQMESRLRTGGYQIYTSLDPTIQESVQQIVTDWKGYPETRYPTDRTYKASLGNGEYLQLVEPQVAAAVLDWSTGELLAIIGGRSVPTRRKQLNRAYQAMMPVGSSLKPLAVYGPAFDLGYSPGSPVINAPLRIDGWDSPKGYPSNFSSTGSYTGVESLRVAMNKSHNTAAAQALFTYVGIENSVNYLIKLGVNREHISATGAGLALGASGISMIEMAAGYGAIANKGVYLEPYAFTEVKDQDGNVYLDSRAEQAKTKRRVFEESTAWLLVDVLKGCVATGGTGTKAVWDKKVPIGGKTGTNSDYRGVTFAGMSGYFSCAVWIGCDNYASDLQRDGRNLCRAALGGNHETGARTEELQTGQANHPRQRSALRTGQERSLRGFRYAADQCLREGCQQLRHHDGLLRKREGTGGKLQYAPHDPPLHQIAQGAQRILQIGQVLRHDLSAGRASAPLRGLQRSDQVFQRRFNRQAERDNRHLHCLQILFQAKEGFRCGSGGNQRDGGKGTGADLPCELNPQQRQSFFLPAQKAEQPGEEDAKRDRQRQPVGHQEVRQTAAAADQEALKPKEFGQEGAYVS